MHQTINGFRQHDSAVFTSALTQAFVKVSHAKHFMKLSDIPWCCTILFRPPDIGTSQMYIPVPQVRS